MNKRKESLYEKEIIPISNTFTKKQKIGSLLSSFPKNTKNNDNDNDVDESIYKNYFLDDDKKNEENIKLSLMRNDNNNNHNEQENENRTNNYNKISTVIPIECAIIHCFVDVIVDDKKENTNNNNSEQSPSFWYIEITGIAGQRCSKNKYKTEEEMTRQLSKEIALMYHLGFKFIQKLESHLYLFERFDLKKI